MLTASSVALAAGCLALPFMAFTLVRMGSAMNEVGGGQMPAAFGIITAVVAGVVSLVMYIGLPLMFVLFYRGPDVKATCEAKHPEPSWTDRAPLPVLALSMIMAVGAVSLPLTALVLPAAPFFGRLLTGGPAIGLLLLVGAAWGVLAWQVFRMRPIAWWATFAVWLVMLASSLLTFAKVDMMAVYESGAYSAQELEMIRRMNVWTPTTTTLMLGVWGVAFATFMMVVRRHFVTPKPADAATSASTP
jgi:hypothetical protein